MDGIVSPVCLVGGRFTNEKQNGMDAQGGRLLGDGCFEHPGQNVKMDSQISYTLFNQCDI